MTYYRATLLLMHSTIACANTFTLHDNQAMALPAGCYIARNHGSDAIIEANNAADPSSTPFLFGTWRGNGGSYIVQLNSDNKQIRPRTANDTSYSISLENCPDELPLHAAQLMADAINIRLQAYQGAHAKEEEALILLQSAHQAFISADLLEWIAHSAFELASLENKLSKISEAETHYRTALNAYTQIDDKEGVAAALNLLGLLTSRQSRLEESSAYFLRALSISRQLGNSHRIAQILNNLGLNAMNLGEYRSAITHFHQVLGYYQSNTSNNPGIDIENMINVLPDPNQITNLSGTVRTLSNLATCYDRIGQEQKAEAYWRHAYVLSKALLEAELPSQIATNLGRMLLQQGRASEALELLLGACNSFSSSSQPRWAKICRTFLGQAQAYLGDYDKAAEQYSIATLITSNDVEDNARTWWYQGELFEMRGQWIKAQQSYKTALETYGQINANSSQAQQIKSALGQVELQLGQVYSSLQHQQEALAALEKLAQQREAARARSHLGMVHARLGDLNKARTLWQQALNEHRTVRDTFAQMQTLERLAHHADNAQQQRQWDQQLVALTEDISRQDLPSILQSQFFASQRRVYERLAIGYFNEHQLELAWQVAESARARGFTERWQSQQHWLSQRGKQPIAPTPELSLQHQGLLAEREQLQGLLNQLGRPNESSSEAHKARYLQIENRLLEIEQQLEPRHQKQNYSRVELAELQQKIKPGQGLLSYFLGEDSSILWLIEHQQIQAWQLPKASSISQRVAQLRATLSRLRPALGRVKAASAALSELILPPAAAQLEHLNELIIQADGALHDVPFPLLEVNKTQLVQRWNLRAAPSTALILAEDKSLSSTRIAVMANPDWHSHPESGLTALPGSALEARQLQTLQQRSLPHLYTDLRLGKAANRDYIINGGLSDAILIHISTHGLADRHTPQLSALAFSEDESGQPGYLRSQEIASLRLDAALVTLSGCGTADGKIIPGEGSLNLARPFLLAGAGSVLASLWNVNDNRSAQFMEHFYQRLLVDRWPASRALADTQRWAQQQPRLKHPYDWAGYVLVGQEANPSHWPQAAAVPEQYTASQVQIP